MLGWHATFTQLREANIPLQDWLEYHKNRRAILTPEDRAKED